MKVNFILTIACVGLFFATFNANGQQVILNDGGQMTEVTGLRTIGNQGKAKIFEFEEPVQMPVSKGRYFGLSHNNNNGLGLLAVGCSGSEVPKGFVMDCGPASRSTNNLTGFILIVCANENNTLCALSRPAPATR